MARTKRPARRVLPGPISHLHPHEFRPITARTKQLRRRNLDHDTENISAHAASDPAEIDVATGENEERLCSKCASACFDAARIRRDMNPFSQKLLIHTITERDMDPTCRLCRLFRKT